MEKLFLAVAPGGKLVALRQQDIAYHVARPTGTIRLVQPARPFWLRLLEVLAHA